MSDKDKLLNKLHDLEEEHKDLDEILIQLQEKKNINLLQIRRLKKRKLALKDQITIIRNKIEPDIIA